jgi:hypothetical protein
MKTPQRGDAASPAAVPGRVVRVRATKDGYAVFGDGELPLSESFPRREDAVAEAELILGGAGTVLVVGENGHVLAEVIHHA